MTEEYPPLTNEEMRMMSEAGINKYNEIREKILKELGENE